MDQSEQLTAYVREQLRLGHSKDGIRQLLVQHNWSTSVIDQALTAAEASTTLPPNLSYPTTQVAQSQQQTANKNYRVRNGVLWILSPFLLLTGVIILQVVVRFMGIESPIINIISVLGGLAGVILIFVGPIIGIIKLAKK